MKLTSVCLCTYINTQKRFEDLQHVLTSLATNLTAPAELIIVDDASPIGEASLERVFSSYVPYLQTKGIPVKIHVNKRNLKHSASQNLAWQLASGDTLIHIEDDIAVDKLGWNQDFAKCLQDHPEVGQVLPKGSGRGEWIPRPGYNEFQWGLGGLFAIRREVFEKIGGWDENLIHQIEPDYNFRVRMAGWRVGQIEDFSMSHLGEGDFQDTFERQAQITIGVYNFLKKWNRRFFGTFAYRDVWCMSPDDFPINVSFRRQLAAWMVATARSINRPDVEQACRLNQHPQPFTFPGHWGKFELVKTIRPTGREREDELINLMAQNYVFRDGPELHKQIRELSIRMNQPMDDLQVQQFLKGKELDFDWTATARVVETPIS